MCFQGKVEHYRVIQKDNKLTIDEEEIFDNLAELVEVCMVYLSLCFDMLKLTFLQHYVQDADGLCTKLVQSVAKPGKANFFVNRKDFEEAGWIIQENDLEVSLMKILFIWTLNILFVFGK